MRSNLFRGATVAAACALLVACAENVNAPAPSVGRPGTLDVAAGAKVVISQIYGAGGNNGALRQNDYVELFNAGSATQSLSGWAIQYTSSSGTGGFSAVALNGSLLAGQYYLIKLSGGANGSALPPEDASGGTAMAAGAGKVALTDIATNLGCNGSSTACSSTQLSHIIDLVGYGSGTNFFEGAGPTASISTTLAAFRKNNGCTDTNNNAADFVTGTPAPRNSQSPVNPCPIGPLADIHINGGGFVNAGDTLGFAATLADANGSTIADPAATYTWSSSNDEIASVELTADNRAVVRAGASAGTATISVEATSKGLTRTSTQPATITVLVGPPLVPSTTFVSELHYDNGGTDADEKIEIEGKAGDSVEGWSLVLYDGNGGKTYSTTLLSGVIPANCANGRGTIVVPFPVNGIQNGSPDGWAVVNADNQLTEFHSYEGTLVALDGPAAGRLSTAIEADETTALDPGRSVQRAGNGVWFGPKRNTFGACNAPLPPPVEKLLLRDGKDLLALGMQTQFFFTDNSGQGVTSVVWRTSDPAIVTVDAHGIVTGKGLGVATVTAKATQDTTIIGTVDVEIYLAPGSSDIRLGHNEEFGEPRDADDGDDFLIHRAQYSVSYNRFHGGANWVSWNLSASHVGDVGRCSGTCYSADTALTNAGIPAYTTADWVSGAVWDRGHMAPSADWTSSEADNNTTFFLSNFLPQAPDLNQGPWERLEAALRDSVAHGREAYIVAGGIFTDGTGLGSILGLGKIWIPDSTWKIAVIVPAGLGMAAAGTLPEHSTVLAVNMPNKQGIDKVDWTTYITTVAKIERSTGYDFLDLLSEPTECLVEVRNCVPVVGFAGGTILRGETYAASGTFLDSDADAWSGTVHYGEGSSAPLTISGRSFDLSHTYATAGTYTVTVSVSDGVATGKGTATVLVKTAVQGIADLNGAVAALGLNQGQTNSLQVKLSNAAGQIEAGRNTPAANMLRAFMEEVNALALSGRISATSAAQLTSYAQRVIAAT